MALADAIISLATGRYTVRRYTASVYEGGKRVPQETPETLIITACVQPSKGRDITNLPEGMAADDVKVVLTKTKLLPGDEQEGDVIEIEGEDYQIISVEPWTPGRGPRFYKCLASLE